MYCGAYGTTQAAQLTMIGYIYEQSKESSNLSKIQKLIDFLGSKRQNSKIYQRKLLLFETNLKRQTDLTMAYLI